MYNSLYVEDNSANVFARANRCICTPILNRPYVLMNLTVYHLTSIVHYY